MLFLLLIVAPINLLGQNQPEKATKLDPNNSSHIALVTISAGPQNDTCVFVSNAQIEDWKAPRLEERILFTYPELESITIDSQTQEVIVVVPNQFTELTLTKVVKHFKYHSYVEN